MVVVVAVVVVVVVVVVEVAVIMARAVHRDAVIHYNRYFERATSVAVKFTAAEAVKTSESLSTCKPNRR